MNDRGGVVVTGASTGIGRAAALHLDDMGFTVFAGVRKDADGEALKREASNRLEPVIVDVADQASIDAAAKQVGATTGDRGLAGLVNNAGITVQGPLEYLPIEDLRRQFEVNVIGQIAATQAFLPQLRAAKGRIVFVSSIGGRTRALPFLGPYGSSKHAIEALADALRIELLPAGIKVSLVEPGSIATEIWGKGDQSMRDLIDGLPPEGRERYESALKRGLKLADMSAKRGIPPEKVAERIAHALTAARPRTRYLVGADAKIQSIFQVATPERAKDRLMARAVGYRKKRTR